LLSLVLFKEPHVRRTFFENLARVNSFDPLEPDNWYLLRREDIQIVPGAQSILQYHESYAKALIELFPEIGLEKSKFPPAFSKDTSKKVQVGPLSTLREPTGGTRFTRRLFFETYARDHNFEPSMVENWYKEPIPRIMATKGASRIVLKHGSIMKGLMDLFPELEFDRAGFNRRKR